MSRPIEFHGKRLDNGIWIEGLATRKPANSSSVNAILCSDWFDNDFGMVCGHYEHVDPATVGQFTGKSDVHNTKIFEHDIVKVGTQKADGSYIWWRVGAVTFKDGAFFIGSMPIYEDDRNTFYEVLGNIFDNDPATGNRKVPA